MSHFYQHILIGGYSVLNQICFVVISIFILQRKTVINVCGENGDTIQVIVKFNKPDIS